MVLELWWEGTKSCSLLGNYGKATVHLLIFFFGEISSLPLAINLTICGKLEKKEFGVSVRCLSSPSVEKEGTGGDDVLWETYRYEYVPVAKRLTFY